MRITHALAACCFSALSFGCASDSGQTVEVRASAPAASTTAETTDKVIVAVNPDREAGSQWFTFLTDYQVLADKLAKHSGSGNEPALRQGCIEGLALMSGAPTKDFTDSEMNRIGRTLLGQLTDAFIACVEGEYVNAAIFFDSAARRMADMTARINELQG